MQPVSLWHVFIIGLLVFSASNQVFAMGYDLCFVGLIRFLFLFKPYLLLENIYAKGTQVQICQPKIVALRQTINCGGRDQYRSS